MHIWKTTNDWQMEALYLYANANEKTQDIV